MIVSIWRGRRCNQEVKKQRGVTEGISCWYVSWFGLGVPIAAFCPGPCTLRTRTKCVLCVELETINPLG